MNNRLKLTKEIWNRISSKRLGLKAAEEATIYSQNLLLQTMGVRSVLIPSVLKASSDELSTIVESFSTWKQELNRKIDDVESMLRWRACQDIV
jgi:hypothetical protein